MARTKATDAIEKALEIWDSWTEKSIKQYGPDLSDLIALAAAQQVSNEVLRVLAQMVAKYEITHRRHEHKKKAAYETAKEVSCDFAFKLKRLRVK